MAEKLQAGVWSILKGSPMAVALLIAFWMSNDSIERMTLQQASINERTAQAVEAIAKGMIEIHTHLDHIVDRTDRTRTNG